MCDSMVSAQVGTLKLSGEKCYKSGNFSPGELVAYLPTYHCQSRTFLISCTTLEAIPSFLALASRSCSGQLWSPSTQKFCKDLFLKRMAVVVPSITKLYPTLCNPMDWSIPGFSVPRWLLEFAQIHAHWVDDAIQPSHPFPPSSPFALSLSQHHGVFQWAGSSHQVPRVLELQHQSLQ